MDSKLLDKLVDAAYLAQAAYFPQWEVGGGLYDEWQLFENQTTGARCYVAHKGNAVDITFTGTQWWDLRDWMTNFRFWSGKFPIFPGRVHSGYRNSYLSVRGQLDEALRGLKQRYKKLNVRISGHSNGGAMAVMCAQDLQSDPDLEVWAAGFGTPAVLSRRAKLGFKVTMYNVIAAGDLVPIVSRKRWQPAGKRIYIDDDCRIFRYTGDLKARFDWCRRRRRGLLTFKPHAMSYYVDTLNCAQAGEKL